MNALFGDATTAMPTPASQALMSGNTSPVPSMNLGHHGVDGAIPGLDIDPPHVRVENGKPILSRRGSDASQNQSIREGVGGWISNIVSRGKRRDGESGSRGYRRVGDDER